MESEDRQGLQNLKELMDEFRNGNPRSELYKLKFGLFSVCAELKAIAEKFQPLSLKALRLQELSDQYGSFPGTLRQMNVKLFDTIDVEFFKQSDRTEQVLGVIIFHFLYLVLR